MKIYLAASFDRRDEMQMIAGIIKTQKHNFNPVEIGSQWHVRDWSEAEAGVRCIHDLKECDVLALFTNPPGTLITGGKDVEFGIALAMRKRVVIVGPSVNCFHLHPTLERYETVSDFVLDFTKRGSKR